MQKEIQTIECPNCGTEIILTEELQKDFDSKFSEIEKKIKTQVLNETELVMSEKDRMILNLNTQLKEMQRKIEQGSMRKKHIFR